MTPAITRAGWIRILIVTVVGICLLPFAPRPKQFWNLHLARIHADKVRSSLLSDPRFRHVTVDAYTGGGGSLMLSGQIGNDEDKAALMEIVAATHPPVKVFNMTITAAKLHKWDKFEADETVLPPGEGPPLTTNWTPNFKDGTINVEVKNMGKTAFQFSPTPITRFIPAASYEHDHDLSPSAPERMNNAIIPVFTYVGSTFHDNRGSAENGAFDEPILVQPNETKNIIIPFRLSPAELTTQCDHIFIWLYFNGTKIYNLQMKRDDKGVWGKQ